MLATEGTYPFYKGGVSTWCDNLARNLSDIDFRIFAVTTNPFCEPSYKLPPNILEVIKAPLWGTMQPADYSWHERVSDVLRGRLQATSANIQHDYLFLWRHLLAGIFSHDIIEKPNNCDAVVSSLVEMHILFRTKYNYQKVWSCPLVWETFRHYASKAYPDRPPEAGSPTIAELKQAYRLFYHFLSVLSFPIPYADLSHSSAAGVCGLPCIIAKSTLKLPYLLTEHGVYLREQYLNLRRSVKSLFVRWFMYRVFTLIAQLNYLCADQISPVCAFNMRWEKRLGTDPNRIEVIYNGCDPRKFHPHPPQPKPRPVVSTVGLIYELKGQLDLIEAAGEVRKVMPDVEFRIYGAPSDSIYYDKCIQRVRQLNLEDTVYFKGLTSSPSEVYSHADVTAFSSISEGFPYVVIEAMLSGAAIVSTDVGGVREALDTCGILVRPRSPRQLAEAILLLLEFPEARRRLGKQARERALSKFTEELFLENYRRTYRDLVNDYACERSIG